MINLLDILELLFGSFFLFTLFALLALYYGFQSRNLYQILLFKYVHMNTVTDENEEISSLKPIHLTKFSDPIIQKNKGMFEIIQEKIPNFIFNRHPIIVTLFVSLFIIFPFAFGMIFLVSFRSLTLSGFNLASLLAILILVEIIYSTRITSLIMLSRNLIKNELVTKKDFPMVEKTLFLLKSREKQFFLLFIILELIAVFFDILQEAIIFILSNIFFNKEILSVLQSSGKVEGGVSLETVLLVIVGLYLIPGLFFTFAIKAIISLSEKFLRNPFENENSESLLQDFKQKYIVDGQNIFNKSGMRNKMFGRRSTPAVRSSHEMYSRREQMKRKNGLK